MQLVKKQLKKHRSGEEHEKLRQLLQRMVSGHWLQPGVIESPCRLRSPSPPHLCPQEQQETAQQERKQQQELHLALKQERRALAQQGHRPYFLKKCEWGRALESWGTGLWLGAVLGPMSSYRKDPRSLGGK